MRKAIKDERVPCPRTMQERPACHPGRYTRHGYRHQPFHRHRRLERISTTSEPAPCRARRGIYYSALQSGPFFALERGWTAVYLGRYHDLQQNQPIDHLAALREQSDRQWKSLAARLRGAGQLLAHDTPLQSSVRAAQIAYLELANRRQQILRTQGFGGSAPSFEQWFDAVTVFNHALRDLATIAISASHAELLLNINDLILCDNAWDMAEHTGQVRAVIAYFVAARRPMNTRSLELTNKALAVSSHAHQSFHGLIHLGLGSEDLKQSAMVLDRLLEIEFEGLVEQLMLSLPGVSPDFDTADWMQTATRVVESSLEPFNVLIENTRAETKILLRASTRSMLFHGGTFIAVLILLPLGLFYSNRIASSLFQEKELADVTLRSIGDGVITTDTDLRIQHINPIAEQLIGLSAGEAVGHPLDEVFRILNRYTREKLPTPVRRCLDSKRVVGLSSDTLLLRHDGTEVIIQDSAAPIRDTRGRIVGAVMVFYDVLHPWTGEHLLSYHATHDPVTALANRWEFERHLHKAVGEARDENAQHALCYLDVDQFKVVNDTCGHAEGDDLLRRLSSHLKGGVPPDAFLARLGGDEFGLLLRDCTLDAAVKTADALREAAVLFRFPCAHGRGVHRVSLSIGVVPITQNSPSPAELLSQADAACYAAKDKGRNRVQVFVPGDREMSVLHGEMRWVTLLQEALEHDGLELHCQEIRPLGSDRQGYCEVLLRMRSEAPGQQPIPPGHFIPAAERYNLMPGLDRWVIEHTLRVLADPRLRALAPNQPLCSINLSGDSLRRHEMIDFIIERLRHHAIPGNRVCFEITETSAIGSLEQAVTFIENLRAQGCHFALDDFGTGLSSFTYLKRLPVDCVKIDGSFIRDLQRDPTDQAMVQAIHVVAQAMGKYTVAEWVEDAETLEMLREIGIDFVQGFHIDKPKPIMGYLSLLTGKPQ